MYKVSVTDSTGTVKSCHGPANDEAEAFFCAASKWGGQLGLPAELMMLVMIDPRANLNIEEVKQVEPPLTEYGQN